jgi:rod shape-determining protein MreC
MLVSRAMTQSKPYRRSKNAFYAQSLRGGERRHGFIVMVLLAVWLLILGQIKPQLMVPVRIHLVDRIMPVIELLSRPAEIAHAARDAWDEWFDLRATVTQLQSENARLRNWEQVGLTLQVENRDLKQLLNFHPEPTATGLTARVIATTGAPYAASMIVTAGSRDGVQKNMAAMAGDGLIGRVIEVGEWSARILLLTDPDSRIPVMLQESGTRAIIAGDGSARLQPRFLPPDITLTPGLRLVTSGHGGLLPPHIPVGIVADDGAGHPVIYPAADLTRLTYVRLVDFSLAGGAANPMVHEFPVTAPNAAAPLSAPVSAPSPAP